MNFKELTGQRFGRLLVADLGVKYKGRLVRTFSMRQPINLKGKKWAPGSIYCYINGKRVSRKEASKVATRIHYARKDSK